MTHHLNIGELATRADLTTSPAQLFHDENVDRTCPLDDIDDHIVVVPLHMQSQS